MLKKIFIIITLGLSIFFTENTFSSNTSNCDQKVDPFCLKAKTIENIKGISGEKKVDVLISDGITYLLGFLLLVSILYGFYGAWNIFSALGEGEKVEKGKTIIIRACIGLVIIFSAYAITEFVIKGVLFQENIKQNTTNP